MGALAKIIGNVKIGPTIILLIILSILFMLMLILDYVYKVRRAAEVKACKKKINDSGNYVSALRIIYIIFYILSIIITYRIIYTNIKSKLMKMGQQGFRNSIPYAGSAPVDIQSLLRKS